MSKIKTALSVITALSLIAANITLDKKTEVYINNYSGAGVNVTIDFPQLIYSK